MPTLSSHRLQNLALLLLCALPSMAPSATVTIDFEDLDAGDSVTDQYLSRGVRFEGGGSAPRVVYSDQEGTQARTQALEAQGPSLGVHEGSLQLHFTNNVRSVRMLCGYRFNYAYDLYALLLAYDAAGGLLGQQLVELDSGPISRVPMGRDISFDAGSYVIRHVEVMWVRRECVGVFPMPVICLPPGDAELSELIDLVTFVDDSVPGQFIRGDADGSGGLTIGDPVRTLSYLFLGAAAPPCLDAADANDSGRLDLSDATYTLGYLFLGGRSPPAPFPRKGSDPTSDGLGCSSGV